MSAHISSDLIFLDDVTWGPVIFSIRHQVLHLLRGRVILVEIANLRFWTSDILGTVPWIWWSWWLVAFFLGVEPHMLRTCMEYQLFLPWWQYQSSWWQFFLNHDFMRFSFFELSCVELEPLKKKTRGTCYRRTSRNLSIPWNVREILENRGMICMKFINNKKHLHPLHRKLTWQWNMHHEWRCISYWKRGIFAASHVSFQGCTSWFDPTWFGSDGLVESTSVWRIAERHLDGSYIHWHLRYPPKATPPIFKALRHYYPPLSLNNPLIRPGGGSFGGGTLDSHDVSFIGHIIYYTRSESRWLATPKRWRFVRGHDTPRLMGVAIAIDPFQVV